MRAVDVGADVAELAARHPEWEIGVSWIMSSSGPDVRRLYAKRPGMWLVAFDATGLERLISEHRDG